MGPLILERWPIRVNARLCASRAASTRAMREGSGWIVEMTTFRTDGTMATSTSHIPASVMALADELQPRELIIVASPNQTSPYAITVSVQVNAADAAP